MAQQVQEQAPGETPASELDILFPERTAYVAGRKIVMREYGFTEGFRLRLQAKPFTEALYAMFKSPVVPDYHAIQDVIAAHLDLVFALAFIAADIEPEAQKDFMAALEKKPIEGELFMLMWWGCNGAFFLRAATERLNQERQSLNLLAGVASPPPSSEQATGTPT